VPGLKVVPQQAVHLKSRTIHPDLVCEEHRLIIEADSFEWHSSSSALLSDCERYTLAAVDRWRVARFGYSHVRRQRDWTLQLLTALAPLERPGSQPPPDGDEAPLRGP
jgi:very-short-patch-repair endonuclease